MNLGVETSYWLIGTVNTPSVSAFSDESWGGDLSKRNESTNSCRMFQHSLMNLGVETFAHTDKKSILSHVSAFSDESWGGDHE